VGWVARESLTEQVNSCDFILDADFFGQGDVLVGYSDLEKVGLWCHIQGKRGIPRLDLCFGGVLLFRAGDHVRSRPLQRREPAQCDKHSYSNLGLEVQ
jgi:hypothetical protein